jgi:CheY-like chemotaxis protein
MRLLIVDDNKVNQKVVQALLRKYNYNFTFANNGAEAYEAYKLNDFECILMDLHMPFMDGLESTILIRRFEKENNLKETPIIAVTASHPEQDKSKCISAGMNDFLRKPLNIKDLVQSIATWVNFETTKKKCYECN